MPQMDLLATHTFSILIVDDDRGAVYDIQACLPVTESIELEWIGDPEEIDSCSSSEKTYHMVILDIRFNDVNRIQYALACAKRAWPDAIIAVLSYYDNELSPSEKREADIVLNKVKLIAEPDLLCKRLMEIIPGHPIQTNPIVEAFLESVRQFRTAPEELEQEEIELYRMKGYVIGSEGRYIQVVAVDPPGLPCEGRRRLLLPYDMFHEEGLDEIGTPYVFRMFRKGSDYIFRVTLDIEKDKPAAIPKDVEELLMRLKEKEEKRGSKK